MEPTVSVLTVTLDRFDVAVQYFGPAIERAGYPFELLAVDNGSVDERVIDYVAGFSPVYHAKRPTNEGYAPALNQMLLRAKGDYVCILDPDILPPKDWLRSLVETDMAVSTALKVGSCGYLCIFGYDEEMVVAGKTIWRTWNAFGIKFYHARRVQEECGFYYEGYGPYGCEDNDFNYRLNKLAFTNYYVPGHAEHYDDCALQTTYRLQKWKDLGVASQRWEERKLLMDAHLDYYVAPPELKDWPG
ncbi:MAG: glycosyltransferase [Patescibacteria group bacterium]|nr:glycosyltransferase [Patescibacteria group bacterium]